MPCAICSCINVRRVQVAFVELPAALYASVRRREQETGRNSTPVRLFIYQGYFFALALCYERYCLRRSRHFYFFAVIFRVIFRLAFVVI